MIVIPAIDIIGAKTVRLEKGDYDKKLSYSTTPVEAARKWESMGAEFLHIVDLDGARQGKPVNLEVAAEIVKAITIPAEIGGGYRTCEDIDNALNVGISRVIVGSSAVKDLVFAKEIIGKYGDKVIISIDVLDGKVKVHGWEADSEYELSFLIAKMEEFGAKRLICTDISKDGTLTGPDTSFLKDLLNSTNINIVYAGGIKNVEHIRQLRELSGLGLEGAITGRAIYDGTLDLEEAISAC